MTSYDTLLFASTFSLYYKFTAKSIGERILKIDQYLPIWQSYRQNIVALFFRTRCKCRKIVW